MKSQPQDKLTTIKPKVTKVSSCAEIWECPIKGEKSLHATITFLPDDIIIKFDVKESLNEPTYLSFQFNENNHNMLEPHFLHYINHSCKPNAIFDTKNRIVRCLKKIEMGEQITWFYPSTEWSMVQGFDCRCGTEECLGRIQGAAHLPLNILIKYQLSDYIQQKLKFRLNEGKTGNE